MLKVWRSICPHFPSKECSLFTVEINWEHQRTYFVWQFLENISLKCSPTHNPFHCWLILILKNMRLVRPLLKLPPSLWKVKFSLKVTILVLLLLVVLIFIFLRSRYTQSRFKLLDNSGIVIRHDMTNQKTKTNTNTKRPGQHSNSSASWVFSSWLIMTTK